jgi:hypothetical protein
MALRSPLPRRRSGSTAGIVYGTSPMYRVFLALLGHRADLCGFLGECFMNATSMCEYLGPLFTARGTQTDQGSTGAR